MKTPSSIGLCTANLAHFTIVDLIDVEPLNAEYRRQPYLGLNNPHFFDVTSTVITAYGILVCYPDDQALVMRLPEPKVLRTNDTYVVRLDGVALYDTATPK